MKITLNQLEVGIENYISKYLCVKLNDWRKWGLPLLAGMYVPKLEKLFEDNKEQLIAMNFVDRDNLIDIDAIYEKLRKIATTNGDIQQNLPVMGTLRFSAGDLEDLYHSVRVL